MVLRKDRYKKRISRRTPGGVRLHFKKEKPATAKCGVCKNKMSSTSNARNVAKTKRRPERLFGGALCPQCVSKVVRYAARVSSKELRIADVAAYYRAFVEKVVKGVK